MKAKKTIKYFSFGFGAILFLSFFGVTSAFAEDKKAEEIKLPANDQCINCHLRENKMPKDFSKLDVHLQEGLSCVGCHGGDVSATDQKLAKSVKSGYIGIPSRKDIPELCGKCHSDANFMAKYQPRIHTDQESRYFTSVHGKKFKEGNQKVATCSSCHTSHSILSADDPRSSVYALNVPSTCKKCHSDEKYMEEFDIDTDQYEKYKNSVHGKALLVDKDTGAPACNDCHGNHGARPPGTKSISHVCGTCHVKNYEIFSATKKAEEFKKQRMQGCVECHGNHDIQKPSDDMIGTGENSLCYDCHDEGEKAFKMADTLHTEMSQTTVIYDSAAALQKYVRKIGMDDIDIGYMLQDSHQAIIEARTLVHSFSMKKIRSKTKVARKDAREAIEQAKLEIKDHKFRRVGFGITTLFISLLTIALYFKIRDMEKHM